MLSNRYLGNRADQTGNVRETQRQQSPRSAFHSLMVLVLCFLFQTMNFKMSSGVAECNVLGVGKEAKTDKSSR